MIGSLLFYVAYPLSRYFARRPSEASEKGLPPAVVNGKAVWDGGAVPTGKFTQSQTTLPDQWLSPSRGLGEQTREGMKEQGPGKEDDTQPDMDKEQLTLVLLQEDTKNELVLKKNEVKSAGKEEEAEMSDGKQEDEVEAPKQEGHEVIIHHEELQIKQNVENVVLAERVSPVQQLWEHLQNVPAEDSEPETTWEPKEEDMHSATQDEPAAAAKKAAADTEWWDEYIIPADETLAGESVPVLDLASLLSATQTHAEDNLESLQPGWHFPVGPSPADVTYCPLWQFPALSYYPPLQQAVPLEVMWRIWEEVGESSASAEPAYTCFQDRSALFDFTVMSYNILAQDLLETHQELYSHCPLEVLQWTYRCHLLLEEILKWAPDILCLQEVQENHYQEHLQPALAQMGYTCVYKRRTGTKTDGCATCYRGDRFSELSVSLLELFRPETTLLDRHNVGVVLLLQPVVTQGSEVKTKGLPLCVANTHLLFNPRRGDVKLAQLAVVLAEIDRVVKSCKARGDGCNVILCGDLNSVPNMPLYQLITTGQLFYHGLPAWMVSGQEDLSHKAFHRLFPPLWPSSLGVTDNCQYTTDRETSENRTQDSGKLQYSHDFLLQLRFCPAACVRPVDLEQIPGVTDNTPDASTENQSYVQRFRSTICHELSLQSAYTHTLPASGLAEVTTLHSEVAATVDYIFYSPDQKAGGHTVSGGLKLIGRLSLLSEEDLWSMTGLPNHIFPSDHVSLLAKFQLDLSAA
ncbi:protein angel homolog 1 isoform X2 [Myripristis murdjan]|uniref:Angel homolog 1 (Drosophila) n=1 Tax=Myripristis murdjan TaxID=586833 RepID=A0A667Y1F1_9TELE|nr:protein angel homolog 1 isoform X2 [Myripristis murdjan]